MSSRSDTHARNSDDAPIGELERLTFALQSSGLTPWEWDMRTGELVLDDAFVELLGLTREQFGPPTFDTYAALCHPSDLEAISEAIARHVDGADEQEYEQEFRMKHADGNWRWIRGRGRIVRRDADGTPTRMIGTHGDVSERRRREQELTLLTQQLDTAQRIAHVGSWYLDTQTGDVTWSLELYRMIMTFDRSGTLGPGQSHRDLFSPESWERLNAAFDATRAVGEPHELELEMEHDGQHLGWILARGEAVRDSDGTIMGVQGVAMDITERRRNDKELERLASRDALTGLLNRSALLEELIVVVREVREARESTGTGACTGTNMAACLLVDLDNFKFVNDSLGHDFGDLALQAAARRIDHVARARDVTARLGGDEFVILLRDLSSAEAADDVAERIVNAFRAPMSIKGHDLVLTASVGVTIIAGDQKAGDLLRDADTAMYAAKTAGRDQFATFTGQLRAGMDERLSLELALRAASSNGELEAWFQPEVDLETGRVTAGETLMRWRHPDGTITSAVDFIRVSEETGLIRRIGAHMLRQACEAATAWQAGGPIGVRVNTSVVQLSEPDYLRILDRTLEETGLRPDLLCLEFTETVLLRETATVRANIHGIAERGVSIAIDDFGTGYASLSYLHRYAVDVVKIDRRFVDLCGIDHRSTQLVEGIVRLGEIMGIDVIAEGVETTQQARTVLGLGCMRAQGYLFSPAVPQGEFLELIGSGFDPIVMPAEDATAG